MLRTSKKEKGYVIKYGNRYLLVSYGGMGSVGYSFTTLNKATILTECDAKYYLKELPVVDEKKNYQTVSGTIIKVERKVCSSIETTSI